MRGREPRPSPSVRRELTRYLLRLAPPTLAAPGALEIVAPRIVPTRVAVRLAIASIEHGGSVAREVAQRIAALLDPATGGLDRSGWRLGEPLSDLAVAATLDGIAHLEGIVGLRLFAARDDGGYGPMPARLRPTELAALAPEGVAVEFEVEPTESVG